MAQHATKRSPAKKSAAKKSAAKKKAAKTSTNTAPRKPANAARGKPAKSGKTKPAAEPKGSVSASQRIDEKIASLGDWRGERLAEIRRLIHEVEPEVIEEWKWMGTPVWSHNGMLANANPFKDKVKVTFHHGAQLEDPNRVFNAGLDGNKWRAIDLFEGDTIDPEAFKELLQEAIAYNAAHNVPKSKGSRAELLRAPKKPA